jgi:hypothetical protein
MQLLQGFKRLIIDLGLHYVVVLTLTLFRLVCENDRELQFLQYYTLLIKKFGILEMEAKCLREIVC